MCGCVWEMEGLICYQYDAKCIRAGEYINGVERLYQLIKRSETSMIVGITEG